MWILVFRREEVVTLMNLVIDDDALFLNLLLFRLLYDVDELEILFMMLLLIALEASSSAISNLIKIYLLRGYYQILYNFIY